MEEILRLEQVTYEVDNTLLLNQFNIQIMKGEIVGVVCFNNQEKEAFMGILEFNIPISQGKVYYNNQLVNSRGYRVRKKNNILVIRQKRNLIESMSVTENVFVIKGSYGKVLVNFRKLEKQFNRFVTEKSLGLKAEGETLVCEISSYEKAVVELCKALMMGKKLIVISDIANYLGAMDLTAYFKLIKRFSKEGYSFIYICDKYEEAQQLCGRIAIVEKGSIRKIIGYPQIYEKKGFPETSFICHEKTEDEGVPVLEFKNVCWKNMKEMSFCIYTGEWITMLDMNNTVLDDLVSLMNGNTKSLCYDGDILLMDQNIRAYTAKNLGASELFFISENPTKTMLFHEMSYMDNFCFRLEEKKGFKCVRRSIRKSIYLEYEGILGEDMDEMDVSKLDKLSLYRLIYYSCHLYNPKIVFCIRPMAGADVQVRKEVETLLEELHKKKITIIELISNVSDFHMPNNRMIIIQNGKVVNGRQCIQNI